MSAVNPRLAVLFWPDISMLPSAGGNTKHVEVQPPARKKEVNKNPRSTGVRQAPKNLKVRAMSKKDRAAEAAESARRVIMKVVGTFQGRDFIATDIIQAGCDLYYMDVKKHLGVMVKAGVLECKEGHSHIRFYRELSQVEIVKRKTSAQC